jgi:F420-non-reducing hydrogenase small subunit
MMSSKPKLAMYWAASCGGCEISILDMEAHILDVDAAFDLAFFPCIADFKTKDVEAMADGSITVTLFNGAIRTSENEHMAKLLRQKSAVLVAYGSCACEGCIPGLSNTTSRQATFDFVYRQSPSTVNPEGVVPQTETVMPEGTITIPAFWETVKTLDQVVDVDYYLPGCPPTPKLTKAAVGALLSGNLPPKGTVLSPDIALCDECPRKDSKPADVAFTEFKRPHQAIIDPEKCILAQGFVCMGPATRGGCEAVCVQGNMPCTGCFGPTSRVKDQGAKILSSVASNVEPRETGAIDRVLEGIPDPVGTFYRYGLAKSLLRRKASKPA